MQRSDEQGTRKEADSQAEDYEGCGEGANLLQSSRYRQIANLTHVVSVADEGRSDKVHAVADTKRNVLCLVWWFR